MELTKENVKVEWVTLGEGLSGDYNPDDPQDIEMLRFDVYIKEDGEWEMKDDGSYCTLFPADSSNDLKKIGLEYLLDEVHDALSEDTSVSIKKLGERLSWIKPGWF